MKFPSWLKRFNLIVQIDKVDTIIFDSTTDSYKVLSFFENDGLGAFIDSKIEFNSAEYKIIDIQLYFNDLTKIQVVILVDTI